ncbi:phosphotransferase [Nonomuraea sp. SMC257]|uniref:Phosphotransferase n=1 Tax=Nonomuraea montanisoli TaxID=2741721 RepID=A0A7Y6M7D9_9ACTN|nr:phosphotransferase [Nonomuraea montanisoli]NUW36259.1 phosphotransferase [Nonomuraea montanisoli]
MTEIELTTGIGRSAVHRRGDVVVRDSGPWTPAVHALLNHLEEVGFPAAPRLVGAGYDAEGRETLTYIEGEFAHPGGWSLEGAAAVGRLIRDLHDAVGTFTPPRDAIWFPWHGREVGEGRRIISHCDTAPWNIVARDGLPVALIDWEFAGPTDPLVELAQACWLNAKLHDDIVAELEGLPPLAERAGQMRAMVDAYGLPRADRARMFELMVEFVVSEIAWEADDARVTPDMTSHHVGLWAMAWRARSARWLLRNRRTLVNVLTS